jgi:hypothetical protein
VISDTCLRSAEVVCVWISSGARYLSFKGSTLVERTCSRREIYRTEKLPSRHCRLRLSLEGSRGPRCRSLRACRVRSCKAEEEAENRTAKTHGTSHKKTRRGTSVNHRSLGEARARKNYLQTRSCVRSCPIDRYSNASRLTRTILCKVH